ncbi:MAG: hypothetical protein JO265_02850 [Acidimicrobiia bacterium]|nr:hypothetical protein [Acidimicrobiia bacterium]
MSWRIFVATTADPDFANLTDAQRAALNEDLFAWVDAGPPRQNRKMTAGTELFEDVVASGYRITYFVKRSGALRCHPPRPRYLTT